MIAFCAINLPPVMHLSHRQLAILHELSKELSDPTFDNPIADPGKLADVRELIKYGYIKINPRQLPFPQLELTEKGRLFI